MYSEVMDGLRNDEDFKPHHRIAAGKELLLRGFGPVSRMAPNPSPRTPGSQPIRPIKQTLEEARRSVIRVQTTPPGLILIPPFL